MKTTSPIFKCISIILVITFLWQQIVFASDYYGIPQDNENNYSGFMSADKLTEAQARQEALIQTLRDNLEWRLSNTYQDDNDWNLQLKTSLSGTSDPTQPPPEGTIPTTGDNPLNLTTQLGDVLSYKGQTLERVVQADGTVLEQITLSDTGDILSGVIRYPDGTAVTIESGKVKSSIAPDGTTTHYDENGRISTQVAPNGLVAYYTYVYNEAGEVVKTTVTASEYISEYGSSSRLEKVTKKDGTIMRYQDSMLTSIEKPDGSAYTFTRKEVTAEDGTNEFIVSLSQYKDKEGNLYDYQDGVFSGTNMDSEIQLGDGTVQIIRNGQLIRVRKIDGSVFSYNRDSSGNISGIILTLPDNTTLYYTPSGDLIKKVDPSGATYYEYNNGIVNDKVTVTTQSSDYAREYDSEGRPIKLVIENPNNLNTTYLFNESGAISAMAIDANLPTTTPFNKPKTERLEAQGYMQSSGVIATDGTYLYIKRWGSNTGSSAFEKVGTGYNGTIAGENYGGLSASSSSYSATYYSDGFIYNPVSTSATTLEKINVSTGAKVNMTLSSGLLERSSGTIKTGYSLITSDGRYVYNLAYHINNGGTTYNGWTVKVYDPQNSWSVVKTFTTGTTSFLTDGIVCDGTYLYAIQWTNTNSAQVAKISLSTNSVVGTFTINQLTTNAVNGQYDWVNHKFYLGSYTNSNIYRYNQDLVNYTPLTSANQETTFKAESILNSAGVLVTDGTYYYVKRSGSNLGLDSFQKIGTGLNGTIAGKNYGTLSSSTNSSSATYYSDGFIYNPVSTNATTLEKINVATGTKTTMTLASGLLEQSTATIKTGTSLITSDGRYVYNVAYHINNGGTTYNGWTVKVYDPQNNWNVVKTYTVGTSSYSTSGVIADGIYLYFIESKGTDAARVTVSRMSDGVIVKTYTINQGQTAASGGQYDWVNNRIVLGASSNNGTYTYNSFIQKEGLDQINTDGMIAVSSWARLTEGQTLPDGANLNHEWDLNGNLSANILTLPDNTTLYYTPSGDLIKKVDPSGATYYEYNNGIVNDKVTVTTQSSDYAREYDSEGRPIKLVIENPNNLNTTYLFNESGAISAMAIDANLPTTTPFNKPKTERLEAQGYMQSSGVIATDGTYLYIKRWGSNTGSSAFEKVGTGYNGTIAGENYGGLSASSSSYSATYYSDGFIYNPVSTSATTLEKINVSTGAKVNMTLSSGLLERSSGTIKTGYSLITSDGRYVYNLAYHINNGGTTYNGWTVKVYDPQNSWSVVKTFTTGTTSFLTDGIVCDGTYLYAIQWTNTNSAQVAKISLSTNSVVGTFTINQLTTNAVNGQYDWVNHKFYLGSYTNSNIYRYNQDLVNYTPLTSANQETTFKAESILNSAGVLVTDGTYYYVKRSGSNLGLDSFQKIGTGLNGTIAGKNYGTLSSSTNSSSATYYSDGFIYNPVSTNATTLEKINVATGTKTTMTLASGLLEQSTATIKTGTSLITSDGRYVYNVAYHINNGGTTYNGWTVKVYDPQNNWNVVKTYTVGTSSYSTSGVIADGIYLYFIESKGTDAARVTVSRMSDGVIVKTYTINQGQTAASGGQYDWVNNRIVLGASSNNGTYTYNSFIQKEGLDQINTDGMIAVSSWARLTENDINPTPAFTVPDEALIESEIKFKEITYTSDFKLKEAVEYNGTVLNFTNGLVNRVTGEDGTVSDYSYLMSNLDNVATIAVDRDGIKRIYDNLGNIKSLSTDGTTNIIYENNAVKEIRKSDGTLIENATFDSEGNIVSAKVTKPDGVIAIYSEGVLTELHQPDGVKSYYDAGGNLQKYINQKGIVYDYSTITEGGETFTVAEVLDLSTVEDPEEIIYKRYNSNKKLIQERRKNGEIINYTYDSNGTVVNDDKTITTYDANNNITRQEILGTTEDPLSTISEYEYGRIRHVYKGTELIYNYTYEFDDAGKEITVIEDVKTGDIKRYKDELLVSVTDKDNLVTAYEYNADKKISKSTVTRSGKLIGQYTYTYDGDFTTIEDIDGVKRTYDKDNKLKYLEEEGRTYAYTYYTDDSGEEQSAQELIKVKDASGAIINYKDGNIESIVKPDGTILRDIVFSGTEVTSYSMEKDGNRYFVVGDRITKQIKQDGTIIEYYPNGWAKTITTDGKITNYLYEVPATEQVVLDGSKDNVELIEGGRIQLSSFPDPNNKLLLHLNGSDNYPLTFNGDAHLDTANAKFGSASLALDGNGDYVSLPPSNDWNFGTGDFTIDGWIYVNSIITQATLCGIGDTYSGPLGSFWFGAIEQNNGIRFRIQTGVGTTQDVDGRGAITPNSWNHLAIIRRDGVCTAYLNGAAGDSVLFTGQVGNSSTTFNLGKSRHSTPEYYLNGFIDEVRVVKGVAKEMGTPPNSEYSNVLYKNVGTFTSNPIELNASEFKTISWNEALPQGTDITLQTRTGNTPTPDATWSDWSNTLTDPSGSQITSPLAKNIQYKVNLSTNNILNTPQLSNIEINYIKKPEEILHVSTEGVKEDIELIDNSRLQLSSSSDPNNKLLLHFNGSDNYPVIFNGNAHLDTTNSKFGSSAVSFDGSGDYLTLPDSDDWNFGIGDFTIDFWVKWNSYTGHQALISQGNVDHGTNYWFFDRTDKGEFTVQIYNGATSSTAMWFLENILSDNTWHHIALARQGNNWYLFVNGSRYGAVTTNSASIADYSGELHIGTIHNDPGLYTDYFNGQIDELRVSKGIARWTSNFISPVSEYTAYSYSTFGIFTSNPIQLNTSELKTISWNETLPQGTDVTIQTRTGNTPTPDATWSDWSSPLIDPIGSQITSPLAKYIQYKVNLSTNDTSVTPEISNIEITYKTLGSVNTDVAYVDEYAANGTLTRYAPDANTEALLNSTKLGVYSSINAFKTEIPSYILPQDTPFKTKIFKASLLTQITLADGTIIKYFNNKPRYITKLDGTVIDNIVLEKYNSAIYDYRVEGGLLISYNDTTSDKVIVSFTAVNANGDTYIFKDNVLIQIKLANGTIINNPTMDEYASGLLQILEDAYSPNSLTGDKQFENSDISLSLTPDNKVTYFINGKTASTYYRYDDGRLELLMDYVYDEAGNLILIRLPYARDSIDNEIKSAQERIAEEKANYLRALAEQKGLAYTQIEAQVQSVRNQIRAEKARLQPMLYQEVTRVAQGCWGPQYYTETVEVPEVRNALDQLDEQERLLNIEEANAYAQLDSEIRTVEQNLTADEAVSLEELARQEEEFHGKIIEQESTPVILEYYRAILGRDPDDAETQYWLSKVDYNSKINVTELKGTLQSSAERADQQALVSRLKGRISDFLNNYINLTQAEKESVLLYLGLTGQDVVNLDQTEVGKILVFLDKQNIHFGRSAFVSLEYLLRENIILYNAEDVAFKAIMVDILVGAINGLSEGKLLELSMYSLSKVASLYGLTLYNTKLDYEDLTQAFSSSGKQIVHLKNDHFVVVTNIAPDGKITYIELNRGQNGYTWTVSKEDFLNSWTGYAMTKTQPQDTSKIISTWEAQRVKGSCLPFLFPIIAFFVQAVVTIAVGVVTAVSAVVAAVAGVIGTIISGIGYALANIVTIIGQLGGMLFSAVKFVGVSLLKGIGAIFGGGLFGSAVGGAAGATATGFSLTSLGTAIGNTVVLTALTYGISMGLDAIGISPNISPYITNFITGGIRGAMMGGPLGFIVGGLQGLAMQGVNDLGAHFGVDPMLTNVISIAASTLINVGFNGIDVTRLVEGVPQSVHLTGLEAISQALTTTILPNVAGELAYYGVTKLGEMAGIDPRISYLAGMGIRSAINPGIDPKTGNPRTIWQGITNGLLEGITSIGINYATQELGLSPLLSSFTARTLLGAIEGMFEHPQNIGLGFFQGAFEGIINSTLNAITMGLYTSAQGDINPNWYNTAYLARILNFADAIRERGLEWALESYLTSVFQADAIDTIYKNGGIGNFLTNKAHALVDDYGNTYAIQVDINDKTKIYLNPSSDEVVGRDYGTITERGKFGVDQQTGKFGLTSGVVREGLDGYFTETYIENGKIISFNVFGLQDNSLKLSLFNEEDPLAGFFFDPNTFDIANVSAYDPYTGTITTFSNNTISNIKQYKDEAAQPLAGYFNASQFATTDSYLQQAEQILGNNSVYYNELRQGLIDFKETRGFDAWGSITSAKISIIIPGVDSTLYGEESFYQEFRPPDSISYIGKDGGKYELTGGPDIDISSGSPTLSGSFEARFKKDVDIFGVPSKIGGMLGLEAGFDKIATTQKIATESSISGKVGSYMSTKDPKYSYEYRTYVEKELGVPRKGYFQFNTVDDQGHGTQIKYTIDPNSIQQKVSRGVPLTIDETKAMLLYGIASGQTVYLSSQQKDDLTQFMYEKARSITLSNSEIDQSKLYESTRVYVSNMVNLTQEVNARLPNMVVYSTVNYNQFPTYTPIRFSFDPLKWGMDFGRYIFPGRI